MSNPPHSKETEPVDPQFINKLRRLDGRYHELVESLREVVFTTDWMGCVSFLNRAWTAILGYDAELSTGRPLSDFFDPANTEEAGALLAKATVYEGEVPLTIAFRHADGSIRWLELACQAWGEDGFVGSLVDVTSRKISHDKMADLHESGGRFVPHEFLSILGKASLAEVRQGDQVERQMTVFFSDMRSFTSMVEHMSPRDTIGFVNAYFRVMEPPITANKGFIDKYVGDCIMAIFETPDDAVRAGVASLKALYQYNTEIRADAGWEPIRIGMGLHTGWLMLGTVGSDQRVSCTVIGDSVNLASRVEKLTKRFNAGLLISDDTASGLTNRDAFNMRRLGEVLPKGRTEPTLVWEVLDGLPPDEFEPKMATRDAFQAGYEALMAEKWDEAKARFSECVAGYADDSAAALYLERCEKALRGESDV
jgi:PAS domain S-box-containing protein